MQTRASITPYTENTLEFWAYSALTEDTLTLRRHLPPAPFAVCEGEIKPNPEIRATRPLPLNVMARAEKMPKHPEALRSARLRAVMLHTFAHHELQALELMCWAILAFPEAPAAFRRGLAQLACDESRHLNSYITRCEELGFHWGFIGVRDWFWQRLSACPTPAHYVATMGIGFEGANLDHTAHFAALLEQAGDRESAELVRQVGEEELPHVRFARTWFERFVGTFNATTWRAHLVHPLSPWIMRGPNIDVANRHRVGMDDDFIRELAAFTMDRTVKFLP